ncbi:hypothetical protein QR680_013704 [Steinernema hermaphroditum]|uniref:Uncharacterized protein n=1 Tax=Steinernema hermaphroditum TaxID=289476 RepID=A0AA39I971_9BILA|nr:hypothetical protein QR680_013704 [Steinernema hermaphroditum]
MTHPRGKIRIYSSSDSNPSDSEKLEQREFVRPKRIEEEKQHRRFTPLNKDRESNERFDKAMKNVFGGSRRAPGSVDDRRRHAFGESRGRIYKELHTDSEVNRARKELDRVSIERPRKIQIYSSSDSSPSDSEKLEQREVVRDPKCIEEKVKEGEERLTSRVIRLNKVDQPKKDRDTEERIDHAVKTAYTKIHHAPENREDDRRLRAFGETRARVYKELCNDQELSRAREELDRVSSTNTRPLPIKMLLIQDLKTELHSLLEEESLLERLPDDLTNDLKEIKKYLKRRNSGKC